MVRASRTGAIDYSEVTRDDTTSIFKEALVLSDLETELVSVQYRTLATCSGVDPETRADLALDSARMEAPWVFTGTKAKSQVDMAVDLYEKIREKKQEKQNG
jgi:hypothetical protein